MPMQIKERLRRRRCRTPLQWNIGWCFVLFTVIVVGLLWIMETVLLEQFYYAFKTRDTAGRAVPHGFLCERFQ